MAVSIKLISEKEFVEHNEITVRRAGKNDFFQVFTLLRESTLNSSGLPIDARRRMFYPAWTESEDYYGYVLEDEDKIVGFLGTLFSNRVKSNKEYKICEIHSWYVEDKYRNESLKLLMPVLGMKGISIVNYTPTQNVYDLSVKFGFKDLEDKITLAYPAPKLGLLPSKWSIVRDKNTIFKHLNEDERKIFNDHISVPCEHLLILSNRTNDYSYIVLKKLKRRWFEPFARVLFISNKEVFAQSFPVVRNKLILIYRIQCIVFSNNDIEGWKLPFSRQINREIPSQYKSRELCSKDFSQLYSVPLMLGYSLH
jgi:hypothetical protein